MCRVPKPFKKFLHPVITAAVVVNVITFLAGAFTNRSFETMLGVLQSPFLEMLYPSFESLQSLCHVVESLTVRHKNENAVI